MNKKSGFTLIELIITLSLTVVILGVIYTFFLSNTKTLTSAELGVDLQAEAQNIQGEILKYGTECKRISSLNYIDIKPNSYYSSFSLINGKLNLSEITLSLDEKDISFRYEDKNLKIFEGDKEIKTIGTNIESIKIRPIDYKMNPSGNFYDSNGLEFSIVLSAKKGYTNVKSPLSLIVKFRNKQ